MSAPLDPKRRIPVLCVDDEPHVLEGIALILRRRYEVTMAASGQAGLEALGRNPGIAVVLSDMRMPGMDGAAFLGRARQVAPDAVRMLLTGHADVQSAIAAINEGQIFRFLTKPCPPDRLLATFDSAFAQYRLVTSERELLEQTLRGSIKVLTDVLSLANPFAFGRATRLKDHAVELAKAAGVGPLWPIEVAAMLSQIGCVALPPAIVERHYLGVALSPEEQALTAGLPAMADRLLANIPRLEEVRAILTQQSRRFDSGEVPAGARVLRIAIDYEGLEAQAKTTSSALDVMRGRAGLYDPSLLAAFATLRGSASRKQDVREIPLRLVVAGMVFADDVKTPAGVLLLARGYEVTDGLVERIRNFPVNAKVRVIVRDLERE